MTEWQPIETAPKDGTKVLLWEAGHAPYVGSRDDQDDEWWTDEDWANDAARCFPPRCNPSHWMPLPPPPTNQKAD